MTQKIGLNVLTDVMFPEHPLIEVVGYEVFDGTSIIMDCKVGSADNTMKADPVSVYELMHYCKKRAAEKYNFTLESAYVVETKYASSYCVAIGNFSYPENKKKFNASTEYECVFAAMEWILQQEKN